MATDEAMLGEAGRVGWPVMRVYRWDRPTLSFGYFMPVADAEAARFQGEGLVRRWTGGGLVHHEAAVTWSLAVPAEDPFCRLRPAASYARLHEALARCLAEAGIVGTEVVPASQPAPAGGLCATAPAPGDLIWHHRKIAGAGQRRTRQGLLHQGVIFLPEAKLPGAFPQQLAASLAGGITDFHLPDDWSVPTARYEAPAWQTRR